MDHSIPRAEASSLKAIEPPLVSISALMEVRFVPLSILIRLKFPPTELNLLRAFLNEEPSRPGTVSTCTAQDTNHINNTPYRFLFGLQRRVRAPSQTRKGTKRPIPTLEKGETTSKRIVRRCDM